VQALFGEGRLKRFFRVMLKEMTDARRSNGTSEQQLLALGDNAKAYQTICQARTNRLKKANPKVNLDVTAPKRGVP